MKMEALNASHSGAGLLNSPDRLLKIDQLREKNIGKYLPLPQLVAVGDQSSGKSSLLESLTGIPFPHGQELCTRYATQISHRRDHLSQINISIVPGPNASQSHKDSVEAYSKGIPSTSELRDQFADILHEVRLFPLVGLLPKTTMFCHLFFNFLYWHAVLTYPQVNAKMGIRSAQNPDGDKTFTEDVLKIEVCGPNEDYLTVIDVPGIFQLVAGDITEEDKRLVRNMVTNYIKDSRTIILAVLPSNVDVMTQQILGAEFAEKWDPNGERTLGILTKPDLVKEQSGKLAVCNVVQGRRKPLTLGYYVVVNRGGDDNGDFNLGKAEAMFEEDPWRSLSRDRIGITALRERLQELLGDITDREFPKLRAEARKLRDEATAELRGLGESRGTEREQQRYLSAIATEFQRLVRAALRADYSSHSAFDKEGRNLTRLISEILMATDFFNDEVQCLGHTYEFACVPKERNEPGKSAQVKSKKPPGTIQQVPTNKSRLSIGLSEEGRIRWCDSDSEVHICDLPRPYSYYQKFYPELSRQFVYGKHIPDPDDNGSIMGWIEDLHQESRGVELGTFSPFLLSSALKEQTKNWVPATENYVSVCVLQIHDFICTALDLVCTDSKVREEIKSGLTDSLYSRYTEAMDAASLLVSIERNQRPYTLNHYFNYNLQKTRSARTRHMLKSKARYERVEEHTGINNLIIDLNAVEVAFQNKSNAEHAKQEVHDILQAYYKVARKRIVDNIYQQVIDYLLLTGPSSPLAVFNEQWVLELEPKKLVAIAGESRLTANKRDSVKRRIDDLNEALEILQY